MRLGLLIIGTELLQGKITDANTAWLGQYLRSWHVTPSMALTTADSPAAIQRALEALYSSCDVVIASGGLGPTSDDITKECLGKFFGKALSPSAQARSVAEANYARMGRELAADHGYGYAPDGFSALNNPSGFAPGLWFQDGTRALLAAPGVPKEFRDMLAEHFPKLVVPLLGERPPMALVNFRTRGIPEEKIFRELCPNLWEQLSVYGSVSSLPHVLGVDVGVTLTGDVAQKKKALQELINRSALAPYVWHEGFEGLEELIVREASERAVTFGFAESCSGGLCSHRMTSQPGASRVFWGSVVSYDNSVKQKLLGVSPETLALHGAVSEACALEMARGARQALGVDLAVALTGIAGPGGGSDAKPVGTLWLAVAGSEGASAQRLNYKGDRETLKLRFSQIALFTLLDEIRKR